MPVDAGVVHFADASSILAASTKQKAQVLMPHEYLRFFVSANDFSVVDKGFSPGSFECKPQLVFFNRLTQQKAAIRFLHAPPFYRQNNFSPSM